MSASTVSITANPAARRRPLVAGEKKSSVELVPADPSPNGLNVADDKPAAAYSRDLSHNSIRGDASKKPPVAVNSTISPRRTRKTATKPEKPRWLTVVSIFTKNFILLLVLAGLVQMVRRLALKSGDYAAIGGFSELESRIAEVENSLKVTANMMQAQVDVLDRRIHSEVGGLRRETNKKIDDQRVILETAVKNLEDKGVQLEKSMDELKNDKLLTKEEFEKMYDKLKKNARGDTDEKDIDVSLDDLRVYAREVVQKEIEKHAADGLARLDYALASGGGMVVKHSDPYLVGKPTNWFSASTRKGVHVDADKMLRPSFGEPGQCFPLKGSIGFVQIRLRTAIIPEAITLEHVAKSVAYDRSSAPKDCRVSGWLQGHDFDSTVDKQKMFLLGEFTYDLEKSNAQTFNVMESAGSGIIDTLRLDFSSNHGSPSHTCIYRLRVHGHEPDSVSMMTMQS